MNQLFPVFLKLEHLHVLLVGGGNVGLEKLTALLANSPEARVTVVATYFLPEVRQLASDRVVLHERPFQWDDLSEKDLVILATDDRTLHAAVCEKTRQMRLLTNVADTPDLCDFYLSSVVRKGDLKIAISTNGKSPTVAKRLREFLTDVIPDNIQDILDNLTVIRNRIQGDFKEKVDQLNKLTEGLIHKKPE